MQEAEHISEGKAMLLSERNIQAVVGGGCLQFKIKRTAEALAQRKTPGFIDAATERRVDDELHAATLVEEALGDDGLLRGNRAENRAACDEIFDNLFRARIINPTVLFEPSDRGLPGRKIFRLHGGRNGARTVVDLYA